MFNAEANLRSGLIGQERQPLVVIDDVLASPGTLVDAAARLPFSPPAGSAYPGVNAPVVSDFAVALAEALRPVLGNGFGLDVSGALQITGFFALATTRAEALTPLQRIPHFDSADPARIALVLYLCPGTFGGTAFFRHRATGFESVDKARVAAFAAHAKAEVGQVPVAYADSATPFYEQVGRVDASFNRLIAYRNNAFHAALLGEGQLSPDPRQGRLTANFFIQAG